MIILLEPSNKVLVDPRRNDIRNVKGESFTERFSFISIDCFAEFIQFSRLAPFIITEIMQVNSNALAFECHDTVHHINCSAIIGRPWNIQTYYMEMTTHLFNTDS